MSSATECTSDHGLSVYEVHSQHAAAYVGASVLSDVEYDGEVCPLPSRLGDLESVISSPSGVRGTPKTDFGVF